MLDEDTPLTPDEELVAKLSRRLDRAFEADKSISAMNRAFKSLCTGRKEIDQQLRRYIGLLYMFEEFRPASRAELAKSEE